MTRETEIAVAGMVLFYVQQQLASCVSVRDGM